MMNGYNFDALNNTLTISASFAKKASKVGSLEYNIILKLRKDFPDLTIQQEAKKKGKKGINYTQMEDFIAMHRNKDELKAEMDKVRQLSRIQPMPYKYVKTWFENRFPYFSDDQPTFDADGFIVDAATLKNMLSMVQEVKAASPIRIVDDSAIIKDKMVV